MFRERNEWPSTAGGVPAEERSGYMELCEVSPQRHHSTGRGMEAEPSAVRPFGSPGRFRNRSAEPLPKQPDQPKSGLP